MNPILAMGLLITVMGVFADAAPKAAQKPAVSEPKKKKVEGKKPTEKPKPDDSSGAVE